MKVAVMAELKADERAAMKVWTMVAQTADLKDALLVGGMVGMKANLLVGAKGVMWAASMVAWWAHGSVD